MISSPHHQYWMGTEDLFSFFVRGDRHAGTAVLHLGDLGDDYFTSICLWILRRWGGHRAQDEGRRLHIDPLWI